MSKNILTDFSVIQQKDNLLNLKKKFQINKNDKDSQNNKNSQNIKNDKNDKNSILATQLYYNVLRDVGLLKRQIISLVQIQNFIKKYNYKQILPDWDKPNAWLSNIEISDVLKQLQPKNYTFLGVFSSDYDKKQGNQCFFKEVCEINYNKLLENGYESFGIVFNLSRLGERGTHWVSIYGSLCNNKSKNKQINIFYYDSNGQNTSGDIKRFIQQVIDIDDSVNITLDTDINILQNKTQHQQYSNSECGMFCIFFIISMLIRKCNCDTCYEKFLKTSITDLDVFPLRWLLFKNKYKFNYDDVYTQK